MVLSIVPDVEIQHVAGLIARYRGQPNCVEVVIDELLSGYYPKASVPARGNSHASTSSAKAGSSTGANILKAADMEKYYMDFRARKQQRAPSADYCIAR